MLDEYRFRGISATTHVDKHGENLTRENLEYIAKNYSDGRTLIYWNHETTLPPLGIITNAWVEGLPDGEHQLVVEGYTFRDGNTVTLPMSDIQEIEIDTDKILQILKDTPKWSSGFMEIRYDP